MKKKLLTKDDVYLDFVLVAIHTNISDDLKFIYLINKHFKTKFCRGIDLDIVVDKQEINYPVYDCFDFDSDSCYQLIRNTPLEIYNNESSENSLEKMFQVKPYLISAYKKFNFLLRIEGGSSEDLFINKKEINKNIISAKKEIKSKKIKGIKNLIF